jgi:hypothetical protein
LPKGFKDVTAEVPDARWAAAGDVIVYAWSDTTWETRKEKDPKSPNHGHIDIRDYDFYISDFIPLPPGMSGHPRWFRQYPKDASGQYPAMGSSTRSTSISASTAKSSIPCRRNAFAHSYAAFVNLNARPKRMTSSATKY